MDLFYISVLLLLVIIVLLYLYIGIRGIKKIKGSAVYFLLGITIGALSGFLVFYILHATRGSQPFQHIFLWWRALIIISIVFGGLLSIYLYIKITKK